MLLTLSAVLLAVIACGAAEPETSSFLQNGVTAHRGNSSEFPENTLPAFASGIDVGADWIELDIFRTKDGKLIVSHDQTTARTGDRNLSVTGSTYQELLTVDVATDYRRRTGKSLKECPPQTMPLLDEVLRLVVKQNRTRVSIQPKMDCVADAVALVKKLNAEKWVGFNDGDLKLMSEVKRLAPELPVFWDRGAETHINEDIRISKMQGFETLVLHYSGITPEKVQKIKGAGIKIGAWTVNDRTTMDKLLKLGIERIYTDYPRMLLGLKEGQQFRSVDCEGTYPQHLQGVCVGGEAIYWSFTTTLVKTDRNGKVLLKVPVASHHGDLCFRDGKLFVAVNLGKFNDPKGNADSWVYVYNADNLAFASKHKTSEALHGAGGIGTRNGHFFIVGGLPEGVPENYVYEYDAQFKFVRKHVVPSGHTQMGIQTATFANDRWWFGCYGSPKILLVCDADFKLIGRYEYDCSLGIVGLPDCRFLSASGRSAKDNCTGSLRTAIADEKGGLKIVAESKSGN